MRRRIGGHLTKNGEQPKKNEKNEKKITSTAKTTPKKK